MVREGGADTARLPDSGSLLVIHHWDTDGASSAALIAGHLRERGDYNIDFAVPEVGTYRLLPGENILIPRRDYSAVFIADYSVPHEDTVRLSESLGVPVTVFDHHLREDLDEPGIFYNNPVAAGDKGTDWPSCTCVVRNKLGLDISDLVILGIAGDYGETFYEKYAGYFPEVKKYLKEGNRKPGDYVKAKDLADSHYKVNDRGMLGNLASRLMELKGDPCKILLEESWGVKAGLVRKEVEKYLNRPPGEIIGGRLELRSINTKMSIISELALRLSFRTKYDFVMISDDGFFKDTAQIYIRRGFKSNRSTGPFKKIAEELGGQAGGKEEVAGILLKKTAVCGFMKRIKKYFNYLS